MVEGLTSIRASIILKQIDIIQNVNTSELPYLFERDSNVVTSVQISFSYHRFVSYRISLHNEFLIKEKKICKIQHIGYFYGLYMLSYDSVRSDTAIELQSRLFEHTDLSKRTKGISDPF